MIGGMDTALLVLAAGMGSRFGGVKQVEPVGPRGETILEYTIYDALRAGFGEILFLVRSAIEADFRERILARLPSSIRRRLIFQETEGVAGMAAPARAKPWGTGHALLCASGAIRTPFAVVNADDYYGRSSLRLVRDFLAASDPLLSRWCMAGFRLRNTTSLHGSVSRGICRLDSGGRLASVAEHPRIEAADGGFLSSQADGTSVGLRGDEIASMNLWGFTPTVFDLAKPLFRAFLGRARSSPTEEFYLPALVDDLVLSRQASVDVLETDEAWFGLTHRADLSPARERIAALVEGGFYPSPLWG